MRHRQRGPAPVDWALHGRVLGLIGFALLHGRVRQGLGLGLGLGLARRRAGRWQGVRRLAQHRTELQLQRVLRLVLGLRGERGLEGRDEVVDRLGGGHQARRARAAPAGKRSEVPARHSIPSEKSKGKRLS
jgi:hypothetical protein